MNPQNPNVVQRLPQRVIDQSQSMNESVHDSPQIQTDADGKIVGVSFTPEQMRDPNLAYMTATGAMIDMGGGNWFVSNGDGTFRPRGF